MRERTVRGRIPGALAALALLLGATTLAAPQPAATEVMHPVEPPIRPDFPTPEPPAPPNDAGSPFLLKTTQVRTVVSGPIAHVVVTQGWQNPNSGPVDGLYIFPLPENAAVTDMQLRIGDRTVKSDMKRREEALAIYEQARNEGRVAGLLDQERPNIFAQRVANIMPGMEIDVILSFDQEITCEDGDCEYFFPTVVGPRFIPAHQTDPGAIAPPVIPEGRETGQRLFLTLDLNAGVRIRNLESPSHRIEKDRHDSTRYEVTLADSEGSRLDRDFRLRWQVGGERPELGLLTWRDAAAGNEPGTFTLILQPQANPTDEEAAPRELVFVLDCSGSMSGVPIEAAKNVVRKALRAVRSQDTFNILRFSETASGLGPRPIPATRSNVQRALRYLESLHGSGGTMMIEGIKAALDFPEDPERIRIVAFLTDGYIGNEREIFAAVRRKIGETRLFSFGIGSSVNRYLLEGLAEEGRGMAAFLGPREKPEEMVDRFVKRINTPVLTDIRLHWEDVEVEDLEPARIPDLFAGRSLLIHGRYRKPGTGLVIVEGRRMGRVETLRKVVLFHDREDDHEAIGRLWARSRIHRLERQLHDGMREDVKEAIISLGLRHRLMTHWTSLVAVDTVVSNTTGQSQQVEIPVEMPQDVSYEGVFGSRESRHKMANSPHAAMQRSVRSVGGAAGGVAFGVPGGVSVAPQMAPPLPSSNVPLGESSSLEDKDEVETLPDEEQAVAGLEFSRLVLHRGDGTSLVVEADGEIWEMNGRRRTLVHSLSAVDLEGLRLALQAAGADGWAGGAVRSARLIAEGDWGRTSISLPARNAAVASLVSLLEGWAR